MREQPRVLVLGDDQPRIGLLRERLGRAAEVSSAEDLPQALAMLAREAFEAAFCDSRFYCGTWREALDCVQSLYPDLPVIVVSRPESSEGIEEWTDVIAAGAFDVLPWPGGEQTALPLLEHALASAQGRALRARG